MVEQAPPPLDYIVEQLRPLALPITDLTEDPVNARKHPERNLQAVVGSLKRFGQRKPVVVNKRDMIVEAGNGTLQAARELGWTHLAVVLVDDDPVTATGFAIADNRSAELAEWDEDVLAKLMKDLSDTDEDLDALGWSQAELASLISSLEPEPQPEPPGEPEPGPVPENPVSEQGKVYDLGPHRLLCGDCRDPETWATLLAGTKLSLVVTSPPYASQRKYDEESGFRPIPPADYTEWFEPLALAIKANLAKDGSFFLNIKEHCYDGERSLYVKDLTLAHKRAWGFRFVDEFAWPHGGTPKAVVKRFKNGWEPIFQFTIDKDHKFRPGSVMHPSTEADDYWFGSGLHSCMEDVQKHGHTAGMALKGVPKPKGHKRGKKPKRKNKISSNPENQGTSAYGKEIYDCVTANTDGMAYPSNVLKVGKNREALGHPAAYAIALPEFFINAYTDKGDPVADPFMGSGSTLLAAAKTERVCYGWEISPGYCDVIRLRWGEYARSAKLDPGPGAL